MSKCNRCGKEFDYPDDEFDEFNYPSFKVKKHVNQWTTHGNVSGWRTIELCPRCYEELKKNSKTFFALMMSTIMTERQTGPMVDATQEDSN